MLTKEQIDYINEKLLAMTKEERLSHHSNVKKTAKITFHSCAIEGSELTYLETLEICKQSYYSELFAVKS
jgi:hypothetical protein